MGSGCAALGSSVGARVGGVASGGSGFEGGSGSGELAVECPVGSRDGEGLGVEVSGDTHSEGGVGASSSSVSGHSSAAVASEGGAGLGGSSLAGGGNVSTASNCDVTLEVSLESGCDGNEAEGEDSLEHSLICYFIYLKTIIN